MCGIASIFAYHKDAPPFGRNELVRIREAMAVRGPDGKGLWISEDRRIGLAHRRLSIIDLSEKAAQPMAIWNGRYRIVFNGEIYNYQALRRELEATGRRFQSTSDTEVLLHLYAAHGPKMVDALRGMFSFAIWDGKKRGMFLARDYFGIKPLYIHDDGKTFCCASQVKALLAGGGIKKKVEPAGHVGFFLWGSVPEPYTLYQDVFALPAGHTLWIDENGPRAPQRFFDVAEELALHAADKPAPERSIRDALQNALRDSVQHHLIADVPVDVFLSAGVDSGTLTALTSEQTPDIHAVTLGFKEYAGLFEYGGTYGGAYLLRRALFMPWELPEVLDPDLVREGWETLQPMIRMNDEVAGLSTSHAKISALELTHYMRNTLLRDSDWAAAWHIRWKYARLWWMLWACFAHSRHILWEPDKFLPSRTWRSHPPHPCRMRLSTNLKPAFQSRCRRGLNRQDSNKHAALEDGQSACTWSSRVSNTIDREIKDAKQC